MRAVIRLNRIIKSVQCLLPGCSDSLQNRLVHAVNRRPASRACLQKIYILKADYYGVALSVKYHKVNSVSFITLSPYVTLRYITLKVRRLVDYQLEMDDKESTKKSLVGGQPIVSWYLYACVCVCWIIDVHVCFCACMNVHACRKNVSFSAFHAIF